MTSPIERMIDAAVRCVKCGKGRTECECWVKCACGWYAERGKKCRNCRRPAPKKKTAGP